jgi:hypothetical protein
VTKTLVTATVACMNTITGGVQELDDNRRWVARITYTTAGSDLIPIAAELRLRPPCPGHPDWGLLYEYDEASGEGRTSRYHVDDDGKLHTDAETDYQPPEGPCECGWPEEPLGSDELAPLPYPGLTLTHLRRVSIADDIARTREAFRTVLATGAHPSDERSAVRKIAKQLTAAPPGPRVGRKRRDRLTVLRALRLYEQGAKVADIGQELRLSPSWVKDALAWSRREGLLVGGRGRGARGGVMSAQANDELATLEGDHHGER